MPPLILLSEVQASVLAVLTSEWQSAKTISEKAKVGNQTVRNALQALLRRKLIEGGRTFRMTKAGFDYLKKPVKSMASILQTNGPANAQFLADMTEQSTIGIRRQLNFEKNKEQITLLRHWFYLNDLATLSVVMQAHGGAVPNFENAWEAAVYAGACYQKALELGGVPRVDIMPDRFFDLPDFGKCPEQELRFMGKGHE